MLLKQFQIGFSFVDSQDILHLETTNQTYKININK